MNKSIIYFLFFYLIGVVSCSDKDIDKESTSHNHQQEEVGSQAKSNPKSPRRASMANIGDMHVHIDYSSPKVRDRVIWGGLVPYNEVWVTGAHKATSINFPNDIKIHDEIVPTGKYAFFTIPDKNEWIIILNKNWDQHLSDDYDSKLDVLRFTVTPTKVNEKIEDLTFSVIPKNDQEGTIRFNWEMVEISFDFVRIN